MAPPAGFSEQWRREERAERDRLRELERKLDALRGERHALLHDVRSVAAKQQELYQRRQGPQSEAERLHFESGELGRHLGQLRSQCDRARQALEAAVIHRRELVLTFEPGERLNPEQVRREIAELELRQQTRALPIEEENALIDELRRKTKQLEQYERRKERVAEHEQQRKDADAAIVAARAEVERIVQEMTVARSERDKRRTEIPEKLEAAGAVVAELREAGKSRAELAAQVDALSREIAEVEREGRALLARYRQRQEDARLILEEYSRPLPSGRPPDRATDDIASSENPGRSDGP